MMSHEMKRDGSIHGALNAMDDAKTALEDGYFGAAAAYFRMAAEEMDRAGRYQFEIDVEKSRSEAAS